MQMPPVNIAGPHSEYNPEEVEDKVQELESDLTGVPLPKAYWVGWMILIALVVVGFILLGLFHLF